MKFNRTPVFVIATLLSITASAQLAVTVSPVKTTGQKAVVPLAMRNDFAKTIQSARAVVFLLDAQGRMVGQSSKWVIGGSNNRRALKAGGTNTFNFVINTTKPLANASARVTFSRIVLESGKLADINTEVQIHSAK